MKLSSSPAASFLPLISLFLLGSLLVWLSVDWLKQYGIFPGVLMVANVIFFLLSMLVHRMQIKSARHKNPNVFVRSVLGGTMIKMAVVLMALGIYALAFRSFFNKASVFVSMGWYLVYLIVEVHTSMKLNQSRHA